MWGATEVTLSDVIFLQALWKHFKKPSTQEKGTLTQIKVLLNCAASLDPKTNMKGCEDFFDYSPSCTRCCCCKDIGYVSIDNAKDLAQEILKQFVSFNPNQKISRADKVYLYATQLMTLLLLWHAFNDVVREGDGDRVISYWKFLLVIFALKVTETIVRRQ